MAALENWLATRALPLWADNGVDRDRGGFHEQLDASGRPVVMDKRARVIGRQIFVYATADRAGAPGPWLQVARDGLVFMTDRFIGSDNLIHRVVGLDGNPVPGPYRLYDQAFCLFGLAAAAASGIQPGEMADRAANLLDTLERVGRVPSGGFVEHEVEAYQSNPHMHLFEAALAWEEAGGGERWAKLADELAELALTKFIDPDGGFLREFFDAEWRPAAGDAGRLVEPGHQFEWSWLLMRWARLRHREDAAVAARRLHRIGYDHGIDWSRGVVIDQLNDDMSMRSAHARLWPQTERIKAAAILGELAKTLEERAFFSEEVQAAARGLELYLQAPIEGLWRDKMRPDGSFVDEPSPASSLYHIACAIFDAQMRGFDV